MNRIKTYIRTIEQYIKKDVHNPLSTMTNLTYILLGWLAMSTNVVMGLLLICVGIASTGFHWTRKRCWHWFDIVMIYYMLATVATWLLFGNWGIPLGVIIGGGLHYMFVWLDEHGSSRRSHETIATLGIVCITIYTLQNTLYDGGVVLMWFTLALATGGIASYFQPDEDGKWYDVFHSAWHIFSGIGIYYLIV